MTPFDCNHMCEYCTASNCGERNGLYRQTHSCTWPVAKPIEYTIDGVPIIARDIIIIGGKVIERTL